ncbi:hypothetical protein FSG61_009550 [Escherichia coli]|nr:hypothetical protein [Escherichia coli]
MSKNDFKAFATDRNANVMSQEEWEALPALLSGFTAGKASSAQVNKAIRQASFIAAALAQYTANKSGLDVLDDGDLNGFISKMGTAFGKDFQALDATLTALAGLATGENKLPYFTGNDTAAQTDLTSVGRDIIGKNTIADILTYLGLGEARYVIQRGANANGAWIRWSDGAIEVFGTGGSNDNGLAKVVYPIALPKLSRFISIAERIRTDYGSTSNNVHVSMIVDDQVTNTGFYVRCQMYDGRPSTSAFSWRVYCAPV